MTKFKKVFYFFFLVFITTLLWWVLFLFHTFPKNYYLGDSLSDSNGTGIVVFTGGKGRIEKGIELLINGKGEKLFISGIFIGTDIESKYEIDIKDSKIFECCISYGDNARNTIENVSEVSNWLEENYQIKKIILVSSYYHLPRSLIIFRKFLPDVEIEVTPAFEKRDIKSDYFFHFKLILYEFFKVFYTIVFY